MLRQAQALKEKMAQFQKELEGMTFTGTAGGGAVTVVVNGKHEIQKVAIDPKALADAETLQDLVRAAVNNAGAEVNKTLKAQVSKMTGGLGLPGF